MTFAFIARAGAIVCGLLFALLVLLPWAYTPTYGVTADMGVQFMTRRAAPLFVVPAVILWAASSAPISPLRVKISEAVSVAFALIAVTGIVAFVQEIASWPILVAAALECLLATLLWITRKN